MDFLGRSKKKEAKVFPAQKQFTNVPSELERLCGDDKESYEALAHTMFLDPTKIDTPMKEAAEKAKKFEKEKNLNRARTWYDIAGGLAIHEGNIKKVSEYFSESERISGKKYPIVEIAEKAVAIAQEYYKKHLKS